MNVANEIMANAMAANSALASLPPGFSANLSTNSAGRAYRGSEYGGGARQIFNGRVQVFRTCNGYIVAIGTRDGEESTVSVAMSIQEVNDIITASMAAFQLENS